ncbi:MAG: hypothetical protein NZ518_01340 [Dehalococcoidia bacterium]|nr:hypothetical protein [Dehalococcoidia bacterium]
MTDPRPTTTDNQTERACDDAMAQLASGDGPLIAAACVAAECRLDRAALAWGAQRDPVAVQRELAAAAELYALALLTFASRQPAHTVTYTFQGATLRATVRRDPKTVTVATVARAILVSWAAGAFREAAAIGALPTQLYRPPDGPPPDEAAMFFAFALASLARGNLGAFERAAANLRAAAPTATDITTANGFMIPVVAALEAVLARKPRIAERQVTRVARHHRWRYRNGQPQAALAIPAIAIVRWAASEGVDLRVDDPGVTLPA